MEIFILVDMSKVSLKAMVNIIGIVVLSIEEILFQE